MSIKIDLGNQVRQTVLPQWKPLLPLFEAVMNSFQAIRDAKLAKGNGHVTIAILRETDLFKGENPPINSFEVTDNGIGLDDENFDSFNTAFSRRKVSAGGKGLRRFTWLKAFDGTLIESTFQGENSLLTRSYTFDERYTLDTAGLPMPVNTGYPGTTITLTGLKRNYKEKVPRSFVAFLQTEKHLVADRLGYRVRHLLEGNLPFMSSAKPAASRAHPDVDLRPRCGQRIIGDDVVVGCKVPDRLESGSRYAARRALILGPLDPESWFGCRQL
jgi:hypothetical protein